MIKEAYINGFIRKLASNGITWSDLVSIPSLQKYFEGWFKYPKVEPGKKAVTDLWGNIPNATEIVAAGDYPAQNFKDVLLKYNPKARAHTNIDTNKNDRRDLYIKASSRAYGVDPDYLRKLLEETDRENEARRSAAMSRYLR